MTTRDLIEKTYWAASDLLSLGTQLRHATDLPSPEELQRRIGDMFDRMGRKSRDLQVPEDDLNDVKYAICAFIDEQVLASPWPGRNFWVNRPLQLVYFNENTAGEGFFNRLDMLRKQPQRANVTTIYFACLQLGFIGKYAIYRGEGLSQLADQVALELGRELPPADVISPHGEPRDPGRVGARRDLPLVAAAGAVLALAFIVFLGMKIILWAGTSSVNNRLGNATTTGVVKK